MTNVRDAVDADVDAITSIYNAAVVGSIVVAGVALPNNASVALHRRFGFVEVGIFREYARKNGAWINSLWMQRILSSGWRPQLRLGTEQ